MKNVSSRKAPVNNARRVSAALLAGLLAFLATGCADASSPGGAGPGGYLMIGVVAVVVSIALLRAVGRLAGELFHLMAALAAMMAKLGVIIALMAGVALLAVLAVAVT
jgi:hypothetical protein